MKTIAYPRHAFTNPDTPPPPYSEVMREQPSQAERVALARARLTPRPKPCRRVSSKPRLEAVPEHATLNLFCPRLDGLQQPRSLPTFRVTNATGYEDVRIEIVPVKD